MESSVKQALRLLARADKHYHALEELLPALQRVFPYYSFQPSALLQELRKHRASLELLKREISAEPPFSPHTAHR